MINETLKNWLLACRPKTLTAAVAPVMIGTAMAMGDGIAHFGFAFLCLLAALSIQIGTNLANDYFDFQKGADTEDRIGPIRVTQAGLIKPEQVKFGFIIAFAITALISLILVKRGGWPIAVIAVISIFCGIWYTYGKHAIAYVGLGELFVLIFFGPVAVLGTYYLQSFELNMAVFWAGFSPGLISTAILCVNNLRDIEADRKSGKKTMAVRFGIKFAKMEYLICILTASLIPVFIYFFIVDHKPILLSSILCIIAVPSIYNVMNNSDGPTLNDTLGSTGKLLLIYSVLFSIGWIL